MRIPCINSTAVINFGSNTTFWPLYIDQSKVVMRPSAFKFSKIGVPGKGVRNVVITLGPQGVFFKNQDEEIWMHAFPVKVIDTTAAGDVFNGALAVALGEGRALLDAVRFANAAAAISVTRLGAQPSAPHRTEIERLLNARENERVPSLASRP